MPVASVVQCNLVRPAGPCCLKVPIGSPVSLETPKSSFSSQVLRCVFGNACVFAPSCVAPTRAVLFLVCGRRWCFFARASLLPKPPATTSWRRYEREVVHRGVASPALCSSRVPASLCVCVRACAAHGSGRPPLLLPPAATRASG